ncbi:MAG TPA: zinc ABC transporter substrate-binding protein, partial [Smithella sp.]|nr:zinc ABC transporter substrate-binding protein [Smithella sp.]
LPPGTDAHHYELKPDDIIKVTNADVFLFTNFELEQWAYKIIGASDKNTRLQAVETGNGAMMLRLNKEEDDHEAHPAGFDPHIWLDMDNAQKMVDNITSAFIKKDPRNSDYYLKNAGDYKRQLADMDQKYRTTLAACKTRTVLHAGHWAFAYLTSRYHLKYIAAYNVFADAEPAPQKIFALIDQIKNENVSHVYYEDMMNPRLAKTIARETGTGLLKLNNGHDVTRTDLEKGETFLALMEKNLVNFQKGLQCPEK